MLIVLKRKTLCVCVFLFLLLILGAAFVRFSGTENLRSTLAEAETPKTVWVIDAGHGGEDGGAVAVDGTKESDINLSVAQKFSLLLMLLGEETRMTRTQDISIHAAEASTLRQKKRSDLENRVEIVNETAGGVLISIHQNSLPSSSRTYGAQVFFGAQEGSEVLAQAVQTSLNRYINIGNEKAEKKIDQTIYLMKNVTAPAILVECGFLSNSEETALLKTAEYQKKLALVITEGILK